MTINQQRLNSTVTQLIADLQEYLCEYTDYPEDAGIPENSEDVETRLVLAAALAAVTDLQTSVNNHFSFDDPPPPKPQRPRPTLVK
jgi:hypothetical protein